ncbi:MAG: hypothetical protein LAO77_21795 [Acidobacteriia bacterium]|nr:hypothetical protein [Terriglobia bacterium]
MSMYCSGTSNAGRLTWEIVALGAKGPYKLTMQSSQGAVVEYFRSPADALARQAELEDILAAFGRGWASGMTIGNC